jgi:hypothetical protein
MMLPDRHGGKLADKAGAADAQDQHDIVWKGGGERGGIVMHCRTCSQATWIDDGHTTSHLLRLVAMHHGEEEP